MDAAMEVSEMKTDEIRVGDRVRIGNIPDKKEFLDITHTGAEEEFDVLRIISDPESESGKAAVVSRDPFRSIDLFCLEKVDR